MADEKLSIESVTVEHALSGEKIYDVLGGSIRGAGKAIRDYAAKMDSYSSDDKMYAHVKWEGDKSFYAFGFHIIKDLEFFSDYEMEKYLLDSINHSIALDFCDTSTRTAGQLDYSWDNHVISMCSSVQDRSDFYQGYMELIDGKHEGIQSLTIHPQMARKLMQEGILDLTSEKFLKFLPREEISRCVMAFDDFIKKGAKTSPELVDGFDSFFMKEYNFANDVTEDYSISKSDFNISSLNFSFSSVGINIFRRSRLNFFCSSILHKNKIYFQN